MGTRGRGSSEMSRLPSRIPCPAPLVDRSSGSKGGVQRCEAGANVGTKMHAQCAAASRQQHLEVAAGLRRLHRAEGVFLSWHTQIVSVVAGNLEKDPGVRPALVG